jgi:hypothetical protein
LNDCKPLVASTSLIDERLNHTKSYVPSSVLTLTSLIDECSNNIVSDTHHVPIVDVLKPSMDVPFQCNLKFQNILESDNISISNLSSLGQCTDTNSPHLSSHNSFVSKFSNMGDYGDDGSPYPNAAQRAQATQNLMDIYALFAAIKSHISDATQQLSGDFRQVIDENTRFKQEMREELDEMREVLADQKRLLGIQSSYSSPSIHSSDSPSAVATNTSSVPLSPSMAVSSALLDQDVQSQMLAMLTDSPSKLSSVLSEKSDSKSDWPKFSGDTKMFCSWYLAIMAQLSLPPWLELYDTTRNDIKPTTTNATLNGNFYSKLLLALEGSALQSSVSKKYLRANGLLLLHDLVQTYKPKNVLEVIAAKTGEF